MAAQPKRSATLEPGTMIAGRYRVLRHLASGGMGGVYEVVHELTGRHHALKLLYESLVYDPVVVARFTQEARAATAIQSPHVVEVTDMGTEGSAPYLVMEMLEGEDLGARISRVGALPAREAVDILGQACHAIACAHSLGIIHRDLKPENLFILPGDFVKVLDFGIAKLRRMHDAVGDGLTRDGNLLGTPEYMSPEQITVKSHLDHRTDVYSLGVILYEMLAGRLPFRAEQLTELAVLIVTSDPPPLSQYAPDLPQGLAEEVHAAIAHSADDRPADCRELARRLAPFGSEAPFAWLEDADDLAPVDREPSLRISKPTPRAPAYSTSRVRRVSPRTTPEPAARTSAPTLDQPLATATNPSPPRGARTPLVLGAAVLLAAGGALALVLAVRANQTATPRAATPSTHTVAAPSAPSLALAPAATLATDGGTGELRATDAAVPSHDDERTVRRPPLRPHLGNTTHAHPTQEGQTPATSTEPPAVHHTPLKNNPFL